MQQWWWWWWLCEYCNPEIEPKYKPFAAYEQQSCRTGIRNADQIMQHVKRFCTNVFLGFLEGEGRERYGVGQPIGAGITQGY